MSEQNLIDRPTELFEFIEERLHPKKEEKKKYGEVFTPMHFINEKMLHDIELYWKKKKNENLWENDALTWYDPASGIGNYSIAIYYKLMEGLKNKIPEEKSRKKHILEKQLFMCELNHENCMEIEMIFNQNKEYKLNLHHGNALFIDVKEIFGVETFDVVIGNPPYNEELKENGAKALYNKFIEYYMDKCTMMYFIVQSRWFSGGKGLAKFRKNMLQRTDIVFIQHYDNACEIFGNVVQINGGVNYFLMDKEYSGTCRFNDSEIELHRFDILVDSKYYRLIEKVMEFTSLDSIYMGRHYRIETKDDRLYDAEDRKSDSVECYVSKKNGGMKYIDKEHVKKEYNYWKVITARAYGNQMYGFGNIFMGTTEQVHNGSYVSFRTQTQEEAESLLSYLQCKLPNVLLCLRKSSQDISRASCKWIPLPPLDRIWTDHEIYMYLNLSSEEISLIENTPVMHSYACAKKKTEDPLANPSTNLSLNIKKKKAKE